ncbi:MAG: hypothetical protein J5I92_05755 [Thiogranum sp.]|nr:hypothetical protein [Thiogranum sp.]
MPTTIPALAIAGIFALICVAPTAARNGDSTWVFICEDKSEWLIHGNANSVWVFGPAGTRKLAAAFAEAGCHYTDGQLEIRIEAENAWIGEAGAAAQQCRNDPKRAVWEHAKLQGADFRATGNEPGWTLEIRKGARILFVADYGASRVEVALPEPSVDPVKRTTRWDAGEIILEVSATRCIDSMSGDAFESTAVVTWNGRAFKGCGRALH